MNIYIFQSFLYDLLFLALQGWGWGGKAGILPFFFYLTHVLLTYSFWALPVSLERSAHSYSHHHVVEITGQRQNECLSASPPHISLNRAHSGE